MPDLGSWQGAGEGGGSQPCLWSPGGPECGEPLAASSILAAQARELRTQDQDKKTWTREVRARQVGSGRGPRTQCVRATREGPMAACSREGSS